MSGEGLDVFQRAETVRRVLGTHVNRRVADKGTQTASLRLRTSGQLTLPVLEGG